jgi:hypothetical protein
MSWHFSRALVEEFSRANCSDGEPCVPWKSTPTAPESSCNGRMTASFFRFPFGTMFVPSTDTRGEELLTWFRAAFLAKTLPPQERVSVWMENEAAYGRISLESPENVKLPLYGLKIAHCLPNAGYPEFCGILPKWGMMRNGECFQAKPAELGIKRERIWILAANPRSQRIQGLLKSSIPWKPAIPWCQNVRGIEDFRDRPDIYRPQLCRGGNGVANYMDRIHAIGNGQIPLVAATAWNILSERIARRLSSGPLAYSSSSV